MERLSASIQKAEADAATLAKEIAGLDEDISVWEGDKKAATEVRELENADYLTTHKDYSESPKRAASLMRYGTASCGEWLRARAAPVLACEGPWTRSSGPSPS